MRHADAGDIVPSRADHYRPHLDGLRCVAVYLVVAFHAELASFHGGFIGVDIFFVLSGYLVTRILLRDLASANRVDLPRFYARRFRRILPAAAATLIITGIAYAAIATPVRALDSAGGFRAAFLYVANWHFIAQATNYFATNAKSSPVLHFWSLAVEEQFYFVWPLLLSALYLISRRAGRGRWWVLRSFIVIGACASAIAAVRIGETRLERAYYGTDTRAYQLLAGALLAMTPQLFALGTRFARSARWTAAIGLFGLLAVGSSLFHFTAIWRGVVTVALTFALIVALEASSTGAVRRALSQPHVAYLGRISYATYLWHWPLIILATQNHTFDPIALFGISALGATALAALSYHVLEHPIRSSRALDSYRGPVIAIGLTISVVAGLAVAPAILRWRTNASADVSAVSVDVPSINTGSTKLVDWRIARNDRPPQSACYRRPVKYCTLVRGTGPSILLMGDSTARMWGPTLAEIAKRESLTLSIATSNGCPWQRGLVSGLEIPRQCVRDRDDWYDRVVPQLDPDIIFVSEQAYDQPGRPFFIKRASGAKVPVSSPAGARILVAASAQSIRQLRANGRKIVLIGSTPLPRAENFNPLSCLSTGSHNCGFRANPNRTRLDRYFAAAAMEPDTWSLDLDHLACPRFPECDPVVNDIIVRQDHSHLTATYARARTFRRRSAALDGHSARHASVMRRSERGGRCR